jgi:UDP:flavonoid glycosyltransferase YjiC (YdhE family)
MAEILCVTWDGGGNVPPMLGIAAELQRGGHVLRVMGHPQQRDRVEAAGLEFVAYRQARPFRSTDSNTPPAMIAMFGDKAAGGDLLQECERRPAELVLIDCLMFGPLSAARKAGLPYATLEHFFDEYYRRGWLRGPLGLAMKAKRLAPSRIHAEARLQLVASLPELDPAGRRTLPSNLVFTGPVVTGVPATPGGPTVLVSLSTFNFPGQTETLQRVLDAVGGLDARVVVTTGPTIDPDDLHASRNTEVHAWLDHEALMPEVSLVIGHGGHATTMLALAHDVPLLVLPSHPMLDQPMVGKAIEASGAGRTLKTRSTPEELLPVIRELLADGPHRAAAARLGAAIRSRPGAATAAAALTDLLTSPAGRSESGTARGR